MSVTTYITITGRIDSMVCFDALARAIEEDVLYMDDVKLPKGCALSQVEFQILQAVLDGVGLGLYDYDTCGELPKIQEVCGTFGLAYHMRSGLDYDLMPATSAYFPGEERLYEEGAESESGIPVAVMHDLEAVERGDMTFAGLMTRLRKAAGVGLPPVLTMPDSLRQMLEARAEGKGQPPMYVLVSAEEEQEDGPGVMAALIKITEGVVADWQAKKASFSRMRSEIERCDMQPPLGCCWSCEEVVFLALSEELERYRPHIEAENDVFLTNEQLRASLPGLWDKYAGNESGGWVFFPDAQRISVGQSMMFEGVLPEFGVNVYTRSVDLDAMQKAVRGLL